MKIYWLILTLGWTIGFAELLYVENERLNLERMELKLYSLELELNLLKEEPPAKLKLL